MLSRSVRDIIQYRGAIHRAVLSSLTECAKHWITEYPEDDPLEVAIEVRIQKAPEVFVSNSVRVMVPISPPQPHPIPVSSTVSSGADPSIPIRVRLFRNYSANIVDLLVCVGSGVVVARVWTAVPADDGKEFVSVFWRESEQDGPDSFLDVPFLRWDPAASAEAISRVAADVVRSVIGRDSTAEEAAEVREFGESVVRIERSARAAVLVGRALELLTHEELMSVLKTSMAKTVMER